jgi:chloramphenicol O-acetyltransferase
LKPNHLATLFENTKRETRNRYYDFKNIFAEKFGRFLPNYCEFVQKQARSQHCFFIKNAKKSPKLVIITSVPSTKIVKLSKNSYQLRNIDYEICIAVADSGEVVK